MLLTREECQTTTEQERVRKEKKDATFASDLEVSDA
jgi:hypothetical protein